MIGSFGDRLTEEFFHGRARRFPWQGVEAVAVRKLDMLNGAKELKDLMIPPANRLEALKGDLKGCHSIRVNDQFRIVFRWADGSAQEVRIVDYH
jgi:proteic killer suppression protein